MSPTNRATACPSVEELVEFVEGRLSGQAVVQLEEHAAACSACGALLDQISSGQTSGFEKGFTPALREHLGAPRAVPSSNSGSGDESGLTERGPGPQRSVAPRVTMGRGASIGRYLVLALLGRGGMGEVYAAYDPELDRRVAVKLLHTARGSEGARRRMTREARALGKLSHPNVVQVHDVGEHEGDVFVAMELVEGQSLDAYCQGPPKPGWQEVLTAYLEAMRGLGAAHEKGIIHRDVKPSNILRGKEGRARVADFGLAAAGAEAGADPGHPDQALPQEVTTLADTLPVASDSGADERLTATGALVGTPLFMAPEQFEGGEVSPASDQFSLCTALYQGLYGALPFTVDPGAKLLHQIVLQKKQGPPASPPAGTSVPTWVFKALVRGLAPAPADRYPSMAALAAALSSDPNARRRPRWRSAVLGVAAVVAVAAVGVGSGAFKDSCAHPERQLSGVWDEGVKGNIRAALLGTGRYHAEETAARVVALLDRYGTAWSSMRGEVCEASQSGKQRREIVSLRDECLDRRLGQLRAVTTLFAEKSDVQVLDKAVETAGSLPPIAYCADTDALTARVRPPEDPALRERVAALQPRVDRLDVLWRSGKYKEGVAMGEPLLAEAGTLAYPPLRAELQSKMANILTETGEFDRAYALYREAAVSAVESRDDLMATTVWTRLLMLVAERQQHREEAANIRSFAPLVVRTKDEMAQARWLHAEGLMLYRSQHYDEAKAAYERSLAISERLAPEEIDVAALCNNLGSVLNNTGDQKGAQAQYERALRIYEKVLGPDHPSVAIVQNNLGNLLRMLGSYPEASVRFERARVIWEEAEDPKSAVAVVNLAIARFETEDYRGAADYFKSSLADLEKVMGPDHPFVGAAVLGLGRSDVHLGDFQAAQVALERAHALFQKAQGPEDVTAMVGLGELALARGNAEEAVSLMERALAADDGDAEIQLGLAEAVWKLGKDRPRARALAEEARASFERVHHGPLLARTLRWLDEHKLPASAGP